MIYTQTNRTPSLFSFVFHFRGGLGRVKRFQIVLIVYIALEHINTFVNIVE